MISDCVVPPKLNSGLLVDDFCLAEASGDDGRIVNAISQVIEALNFSWSLNVKLATADETVGVLYRDRMAKGGRIERYLKILLEDIPLLNDFNMALFVNGNDQRFCPSEILSEARNVFSGLNWAAPSHGDPTDTNICVDLAGNIWWVDPDTVGVSSIAGEIACLLVNLWGHGCWISPRYSPGRYADHPHVISSIRRNEAIGRIQMNGNRISVDLRHQVSKPRRMAMQMIVERLVEPWASKLQVPNLITWLRPWLAARVLGVYNPQHLSESARAWQLATLGRLANSSRIMDIFATY